MKRIIFTCLAALAAAYTVSAVEEVEPAAAAEEAGSTVADEAESPEAEEQSAPGEELRSPEEIIEDLRKKEEAVDRAFAALQKPNRTLTASYTRHVEEVKERMKKLETCRDELKVSKERLQAGVEEYAFNIVPENERYTYEVEGNELVKNVLGLLNSKSEPVQVEGLQKFEQIRDSYQGIPLFAEAQEAYQKVVGKFEKKWVSQQEALKRERQRLSPSRLEQVNDSEQKAYDKLAQKMAQQQLNIDEDWFLPKSNNSLMLVQAVTRVSRVKSSIQYARTATPVDIPALLHRFWEEMDETLALMNAAQLDEAYKKLQDSQPYRELMAQGRKLPENVKEGIRNQAEEMRVEIRKQQTNMRNRERDTARAASAFERERRNLETRIERIKGVLDSAKVSEERRAEEAAAREAELKAEQERAAAEAAAAEAEAAAEEAEQAAEAEKPEVKAPKKKKKKKAE